MSSLTVAVITSTIGREELRRAIMSVAQQDYPCRHYVFVDGEQHHEKARQILQEFPHVCAVYLPMNTGADGWTNSSINAIAPFLVSEDIICHLDDDNFYESHHVSDVVEAFERTNADLVYTLRNMVDKSGTHLCRDKVESIGWKSSSVNLWNGASIAFDIHCVDKYKQPKTLFVRLGLESYHVDTNCLALTRSSARIVAPAWRVQKANDRMVFQTCKNLQLSHACTGRFSVNYTFDVDVAWSSVVTQLRELTQCSDETQRALSRMLPAFYESNQLPLMADEVAVNYNDKT